MRLFLIIRNDDYITVINVQKKKILCRVLLTFFGLLFYERLYSFVELLFFTYGKNLNRIEKCTFGFFDLPSRPC